MVQPSLESSQKTEEFLFILAFGKASALEIESAISSQNLAASLEEADDRCALVKTDINTGRALIQRLGTSYKLGRVIGRSLSDALRELAFPFEPKFNWTISAYECDQSLYDQSYRTIQDLLKEKGLGKSKFLRPQIYDLSQNGGQVIRYAEIRAEDVKSKILLNESGNPGMDVVIHGGVQGRKPTYAQTVETFDSKGFEERDFKRPYQDPTKTVSPRMARMIVNLALRRDSKFLLDPFCGLGTVLQEALLCNVSVVGVDRDQHSIDRAKGNLKWLTSKYHLSPNVHLNLFAYDAKRITHARMPRTDAIATEPILLPVLKSNPSALQSKALIEKIQDIYERSLVELASILSNKGDRIALIIPVLIDSSGRRRTFDLSAIAEDVGLRPYTGRQYFTKDIQYPFSVETSKKKTIQRTLNVFYLL
jgi:hypothetical protein